jgi:hypothetical protein
MKAEYGGLKRFIREHCTDEVKFVRKHGGDDIFSHISNLAPATEIESPKEDSTFKEGRNESYWKAFSNPNIKKGLLLDSSNGHLIIANNNDLIPETFIRIEKVTQDEYRQMAKDFLEGLDDSKKSEFQQAFSFDDFWPYWSTLLRKYRSDGILKDWLKWRDDNVQNLFEKRLLATKMPSNVIDNAIHELKHSLEKQIKPKRPHDSIHKQPESINESLRSVIHEVIDRMSEEELRRIWLPVGLLSDVVKK